MARKNTSCEAAGCNSSTASIALPKTGSNCNGRFYRKRGPIAQALYTTFIINLGLSMLSNFCSGFASREIDVASGSSAK